MKELSSLAHPPLHPIDVGRIISHLARSHLTWILLLISFQASMYTFSGVIILFQMIFQANLGSS